MELLVREVIGPALIGTGLVCGYLWPASMALCRRLWGTAVFLLLGLGIGLVALPFAPIITGAAWLVAMGAAWLALRDVKRDRQHREMLAGLVQTAPSNQARRQPIQDLRLPPIQ